MDLDGYVWRVLDFTAMARCHTDAPGEDPNSQSEKYPGCKLVLMEDFSRKALESSFPQGRFACCARGRGPVAFPDLYRMLSQSFQDKAAR